MSDGGNNIILFAFELEVDVENFFKENHGLSIDTWSPFKDMTAMSQLMSFSLR